MDTTWATPARLAAWRRAARELALVAVLFLAYKAGRQVVADHADLALANGEWIWHLERLLRLPDEAAVQAPLLPHAMPVWVVNAYYAYVHFPATVLCLVWLWLRRPAHYLRLRRALAALTAVALVLHVCVPLAPPRLTELTGLVDTGTRYGPSVYGPPDTDQLSNQYAAMPSLHVGWALAIALALMAVTAGRRRWLWLLHPLVTALVVVVTGNHYWLDGLVSMALLVVILAVLPRPAPDRPAPVEAPGPVRPHVVPAPRRAGHRRNPRVPAAADVRLRPPGRG
ncbi:phosphatase PAP2 family protein [Micromonospora sp. C32]|uniref:phosphatase PAP2 family protein n=1 Tax=unclassified Micromonospora TaxID=2617518 RepID=UPI001B394606|nr:MULTISPECIES: phosphatase PAP2 family protein [unclassified Micromonospora]MBQ1046126.1 phosphatase PAP2 family protein [Micromonospora sp. C72]MBQ1058907.1 phosphatase PAP2 family protein [Micromonospora sp. C32]